MNMKPRIGHVTVALASAGLMSVAIAGTAIATITGGMNLFEISRFRPMIAISAFVIVAVCVAVIQRQQLLCNYHNSGANP